MQNPSILLINLGSFSYKKGIPQDSTIHGGGFIFDCRAITNPGKQQVYKPLCGKDLPVKQYLESLSETDIFFKNTASLVDLSISAYLNRRFEYLSVYYGCTGGQHRSVYFAERMLVHIISTFSSENNIEVQLTHRDNPV